MEEWIEGNDGRKYKNLDDDKLINDIGDIYVKSTNENDYNFNLVDKDGKISKYEVFTKVH